LTFLKREYAFKKYKVKKVGGTVNELISQDSYCTEVSRHRTGAEVSA